MKKSCIINFIPYKQNFGISKVEEYIAYNTFKYAYYPLFRERKGLFLYEWHFFHGQDGKSIRFYEEDDAKNYINTYKY